MWGNNFARYFSVAVLLVAIYAKANAAPIVVDTFETSSPPGSVGNGAANFGSFASTIGPGILGTRSVSYDKGGSGTLQGGDFVGVGGGILEMDSGATGPSIMVDAAYSSFGSLNVNGYSSFDITFIPIVDNGIGTFNLALTLLTSSGTLSTTVTVPDSFTGGTLSIPLASLIGPGNLSNVTGIQLSLNNTAPPSQAADFSIDQLQFTDQVVPEPASLALWALVGVAGVWYGRRRLKTAIA